jgi:hypothetical protein
MSSGIYPMPDVGRVSDACHRELSAFDRTPAVGSPGEPGEIR